MSIYLLKKIINNARRDLHGVGGPCLAWSVSRGCCPLIRSVFPSAALFAPNLNRRAIDLLNTNFYCRQLHEKQSTSLVGQCKFGEDLSFAYFRNPTIPVSHPPFSLTFRYIAQSYISVHWVSPQNAQPRVRTIRTLMPP